jgi:hypothetical protein
MSIDLSSYINFDNIPKLTQKICTNQDTNQNYTIVGYDKSNYTDIDRQTVGLLRSVVYNDIGQVVVYSPQSSINVKDELFIQTFPMYPQEYIDGTMINVFWDENINDWEIATSRCVGANLGFYIKPYSMTFREMFFETCEDIGLDLNVLLKDINGNRLSYSFVLQHVNNRIVTPIYINALYLINIYEIKQDSNSLIIYPHPPQLSQDFPEVYHAILPNTYIQTPKSYDIIYTLEEFNKSIHNFNNTIYNIKGIVYNDLSDNSRSKCRNIQYEYVSVLKGHQPKLQYRYYELVYKKQLEEYYLYYPEDTILFNYYESLKVYLIDILYYYYVSCYIKHTCTIETCPYEYRPHMKALHSYYLSTLKSINLYVTDLTVHLYVNKLPIPRLMYTINYHKKLIKSG